MSHFKEFGKYEIVRKLSRSLTDVYLVRDTEADRLAVLKLVEQSRDEFTELVIEAERRGAILQQQLHHTDARILEIFEFGEQQNCFFVAMEYFEGKTLAELVREEGPLEPKRAAGYVAEICSQLKTLHSFTSDIDGRRSAVVHGDVKPSNIQVGANGDVRLLDFGIAKVITLTRNLTHHSLGSPSYCSPERLSKGEVDAHVDLWALGVSLYEIISGVPPYQAENTRKLENLIQSGQPPRAVPQNCPASLKAIIEKSLAARLGERYSSAAAFEGDLRSFLAGQLPVAEKEVRGVPAGRPTVLRQYVPPKSTRVVSRTRTVLARSANTLKTVRPEWRNLSAALAAGFLFGLLILMPVGYLLRFQQVSRPVREHTSYTHAKTATINSDWQLYQHLRKKSAFLGRLSPALSLSAPLHSRFVSAADAALNDLRNTPDKKLSDVDWAKAQLCLRHALELDPSDRSARGKLALCTAYRNLANHPRLPKAAASLQQFKEAQRLLPASPDPHLGLARLYVYSYRNIEPALAEWQAAQELGYHLGPREAEEQADGYLSRAEWELLRARYTIPRDAQKNWLELARADTDRAQNLYGLMTAASDVQGKLRRLNRARAQGEKLYAAQLQPASYLNP